MYDPPRGSLLVPFNEQLSLPVHAAPAATHADDEDLVDSMSDPSGDEAELRMSTHSDGWQTQRHPS